MRERRLVRSENGVGADVVGQCERSLHRFDVGDDLARVGTGRFAQGRLGDRARGGGEILDLRTRGGLGAQQHGGERRDLPAELGVEARDLLRGLRAGRHDLRRQAHLDVGDDSGNRSLVRPPVAGQLPREAVPRG